MTVLLKTDRIPIDPLHAAGGALDRDVARLERIHRSRRWADPLNQRFERVVSEARFAFTSGGHRMKLDEDRSAAFEQRASGGAVPERCARGTALCPREAARGKGVTEGVRQNRDRKFDLQLSQALIAERRLADIFSGSKIERIELKSESYQWEQTGNIAIEYRCDGRPSGISTTEADFWVHELKRDGETFVYLMFPIERLKALCCEAIKRGRSRHGGGDGGRFDNIILSLKDILR